jgi:uncharacterized membrane protein
MNNKTVFSSVLSPQSSVLLVFLGWPLAAWAQSDAPLPSLETGALLIVHPICVHFAAALTVFGVGLDCIGSLRSEASWQQAGRFCFFAGVVATGLAVLSGWIEQQLPRPTSLYDTQIQELLFYHEYLGYGLLGFFIVLMVARLQIAGRLPILFVMLSMLGLAGLVIQGYLGGELVYRYGAGVRAVQIFSQQQLNEQKKAPE